MKDMRNSWKIKVSVLALLIVCMAGIVSSVKVSAVSSSCHYYVSLEGDGDISGTVGSEITPYYFTMTVYRNSNGGSGYTDTPSFTKAYQAGADVTSLFKGYCNPEKNQYALLPVGLKVTVADAIKAGDTSARFKISGTPYMGSSIWLQVNITEAFFDGNSQHTQTVEKNTGLRFNITRSSTSTSIKLSPDSLKITGTKGTAIAAKELTFSANGNFLTSYSQGYDVSDWFRSSSWIINYDGIYMTARLPEGLTVKLKNAVKIGDSSCTFVISGTPAYGADEYLVPEFPAGIFALPGSDKSEHGYGDWGFSCNNDYMIKIAGETNKPGIELESLKVAGVETANITCNVNETLPDNLMTFRLKNCRLATSYAEGHDITGFFLKWSYPFETYVFESMGVKVEVVSFVSGNDYFTCKLVGTPKKNGHGSLTVKLMEEHTTANVRMSSISTDSKGFGFSTPDETSDIYITPLQLDFKLGYMMDTSDTPVEIEMSQGYSTEYCLYGTFKKDQDVSNLVSGLPSGVKAYSAENATNPASLLVYFKGVPQTVSTFKVYAEVSGVEYASKTSGGWWTASSGAETKRSSYTETYVTINITAASEYGFAYSYLLDPDDDGTGAVSGLPYEKLKSKADSEPIKIQGSITTKQYVLIENGTARIEEKSVYTGKDIDFWVYIPQITFSKSYNALYKVNDLFRLMKVDGSGNTVSGPVNGYEITTETAIEKGKQTGVNILIFISGIATSATPCFDGLKLQVNDNGTWRDIKLPTGSSYEIGQVITGQVPINLNSFNGPSASIADCVINGISGQTMCDRRGIEVTIDGAAFKYLHKGADVTDWFTNLPSGMGAVVKEDAPAGSTTVKIRFGKLNKNWKIGTVTPTQPSSEAIGITIPFKWISGEKYSGMDGGVAAALNQNARYNIMTAESFVTTQKVMIISTEFNGVYNKNGGIGEGTGTDYAVVYIPGDLISEYTVPVLDIQFIPEEGDFSDENQISAEIVGFTKIKNISSDIYFNYVHLYLPMINANRVARGQFELKAFLFEDPGDGMPDENTFKEVTFLPSYVGYNIHEPGTTIADEDTVPEGSVDMGGNESGSSSGNNGSGGSGSAPAYLQDFENKEGDVIVYAADASGKTVSTTFINLTQEKIASDIAYKCYSTDGGSKWKETSKFTDKQIDAMLKKGMTLSIADKYDKKAKKPSDNAIVYTFEAINKRPAAPKLKVDYKTYADPTGFTPGQWTLADKSGSALSKEDLANYEIGIAGSDKKTVSSKGYEDIPAGTGMDFEMVSGKTADSTIYIVRTKATKDTPASKPGKITVKGQGKAIKAKADYKKEILKVKKGTIVYFGDKLSAEAKELEGEAKSYSDYAGKYIIVDEALAKSGIDISGYITDTRNTVMLWTGATEKKASTLPLTIKLAKRDSIKAEKLNVTGGKLKLDKKYEVYDEAKDKWGNIPKITDSCELKIRLKATAKGGAESDSKFAASGAATLKVTYGVINAEKNTKGVTEAEIVSG